MRTPLLRGIVLTLIAASAALVAAAPVERTPAVSVLVLGTAQDGGLPHASCACTRCEAARRDPARRRLISSLALLAGEKAFLVDATPDLREQLDLLAKARGRPQPAGGAVDRAPLDGVLLTHAHIGHYLGLAFFGFEAVHTKALPVHATARMSAFLRANGPWSQLVAIGNIELRELRPEAPVELAPGLSVTALRVPHRDELSDTVGFFVRGPRRTLLYVPDTEPWRNWERPLVEVLRGVDVALLDATFYDAGELPGRDVTKIGHPLVTSTLDLLAPLVASGKLEVAFTHLNHSNPALEPGSAAAAEIARRGFRVLAEGERIEL